MIRVLLDQGLPPSTAALLREFGWECSTPANADSRAIMRTQGSWQIKGSHCTRCIAGLGASPAIRVTHASVLEQSLDSDTLYQIRESAWQSVVSGSRCFCEQIEHTMDIRAEPSRRGRPKKIKE